MSLFDDVDIPNRSDDGSFHISLTGHRPHKLDGYKLSRPFYSILRDELVHLINNELSRHSHLTLHSGLALGADTIWSRAIMASAAKHPEQIRFVAEVPCMSQANRWVSKNDRSFWQEQIDTADLINVYADSYSPQAMQLRNEGMVGASDLVVAIWDGSTGGTHHAVKFARKLKIDTIVISPEDIRKLVARKGR